MLSQHQRNKTKKTNTFLPRSISYSTLNNIIWLNTKTCFTNDFHRKILKSCQKLQALFFIPPIGSQLYSQRCELGGQRASHAQVCPGTSTHTVCSRDSRRRGSSRRHSSPRRSSCSEVDSRSGPVLEQSSCLCNFVVLKEELPWGRLFKQRKPYSESWVQCVIRSTTWSKIVFKEELKDKIEQHRWIISLYSERLFLIHSIDSIEEREEEKKLKFVSLKYSEVIPHSTYSIWWTM